MSETAKKYAVAEGYSFTGGKRTVKAGGAIDAAFFGGSEERFKKFVASGAITEFAPVKTDTKALADSALETPEGKKGDDEKGGAPPPHEQNKGPGKK